MIVRRVSASMGTSAAPLDGGPERLGRGFPTSRSMRDRQIAVDPEVAMTWQGPTRGDRPDWRSIILAVFGAIGFSAALLYIYWQL